MVVDTAPETKTRPVWWRRPWIAPLAVVVIVFFAYALPPYLTLDPAKARLPAPPGFPEHYWFLVGHILFGTVAMVGSLLQIWPWFRGRYPVAHRRIGRLYVFAGVLPGGLMALVVGSVSPAGPATAVADIVAALLWLTFTFKGWQAARQRRFGDHRRWMIRSFAMTYSIILSRVIMPFAALAFVPQLDSAFGGSQQALIQSIAATSAWSSGLLSLLLSQWWLERRPRGARRA
ncbi:DUF2306 domain-containing protein [Amycolatopsis sp. cg5]|uniref:DUF2306 domain-containing protein n=1 Tax=Amycolatopsis sp. cg5 TaxID=3238802 RepID=UPI003525E603